MKETNIKVIFDTNVWISFLIGKRLSFIRNFIVDGKVTIVITKILLEEIKEVAGREKLKKYFPEERVNELLEFLLVIGKNVEISPKHLLSKDPKDNFLLDLIDFSKADYLVTGDKELLKQNPFKTAVILTPANFEATFKV